MGSGVPEGSVLGPTLFTAYIDVLLSRFREAFPSYLLQSYADDTPLLVPVKKLDDIDRLVPPALAFIDDWISSAGLAFNLDKTKVMVFRYRRGALPSAPSIRLRGHQLEVVDQVKYLGITFSPFLKFSDHVDITTRKATKMLGALRRKLGRHVQPYVLKKVYDACLRSVLEYGSAVWDPILAKDIVEVERAQKFAIRLFLNDWTLSYADALVWAGWSSLLNRRKRQKLMLLFKFYHGYLDFQNSRFIHISSFSERLTEAHHLALDAHRTESFIQSFLYSSIRLWNDSPSDCIFNGLASFANHIAGIDFT